MDSKKKHGNSFSLQLKYLTNSGKVRKRAGQYISLTEDGVLVLKNEGKGGEGKYHLEKIKEIAKSAS